MGALEPKATAADNPIVRTLRFAKGNVVTRSLAAARRFYEDILGLECAEYAKGRMLVRDRGTDGKGRRRGEIYWVLDVLQSDELRHPQRVLHHWGLDLAEKSDVDLMYERVLGLKDAYGLGIIHKPQYQHGAYAFYFQDADSNWWEFQFVPPSRQREAVVARGDVVEE